MTDPGTKQDSLYNSKTAATGTRQLLAMSATTSPQKEKAIAPGWVKFDETDGSEANGGGVISATASPTRSSSGVSSARGSVNSAISPHQDESEVEGGILAVSEVQVIDEHTLKREQAVVAAPTTSHAPVFKQMTSPTNTPKVNGASEFDMDNVNLSDSGSPRKSTRGQREFENGDVIVTILPVNEKFPCKYLIRILGPYIVCGASSSVIDFRVTFPTKNNDSLNLNFWGKI